MCINNCQFLSFVVVFCIIVCFCYSSTCVCFFSAFNVMIAVVVVGLRFFLQFVSFHGHSLFSGLPSLGHRQFVGKLKLAAFV